MENQRLLIENILRTMASDNEQAKDAIVYAARGIKFDKQIVHDWVFNRMLSKDYFGSYDFTSSVSQAHQAVKKEISKFLFSLDSCSYVVNKVSVVGVSVHFDNYYNKIHFKYKGKLLVSYEIGFEEVGDTVEVKMKMARVFRSYYTVVTEDDIVAIEKTAEVMRKVRDTNLFETLMESLGEDLQMYVDMIQFFCFTNELLNELFFVDEKKTGKRRIHFHLQKHRFFEHLKANGSYSEGNKNLRWYDDYPLNTITWFEIESIDWEKRKIKVQFLQVKGDLYVKNLETKRFENKDFDVFFNQIDRQNQKDHVVFLRNFKRNS